MIYPHPGILLSYKKGQTIGPYNNMDESQIPFARKEAGTWSLHIVWFRLHDILKKVKLSGQLLRVGDRKGVDCKAAAWRNCPVCSSGGRYMHDSLHLSKSIELYSPKDEFCCMQIKKKSTSLSEAQDGMQIVVNRSGSVTNEWFNHA